MQRVLAFVVLVSVGAVAMFHSREVHRIFDAKLVAIGKNGIAENGLQRKTALGYR